MPRGSPLPYLYIPCAECLTSLIWQSERVGSVHVVRICRGAPTISHLLFADDSFLFFRANEGEFCAMKDILATYEKASRQAINLRKSDVSFSSNVTNDTRVTLSNILDVVQSLRLSKYLGLPSIVGWSKKATFAYIR